VRIDVSSPNKAMTRPNPTRSARLVVVSAPLPQAGMRVADVFKVAAVVSAVNVNHSEVSVSFESDFLSLLGSPAVVNLGPGSYDKKIEWLFRALEPTQTMIKVELRADDIPQTAQIAVCITLEDTDLRRR